MKRKKARSLPQPPSAESEYPSAESEFPSAESEFPSAESESPPAAQAEPQAPTASSAPSSWPVCLAAAGLIAGFAVAAYYNSFAGQFIYDDIGAITENPTIRQLWSVGQVLSPPRGGETVSGRPLLNLTLAINYALGGMNVWGYHATNLAIHVAAAWLLFGVLRQTLLLPALRQRFGGAATALAFASAALWVVHPLQSESVTYIVQRAESLGSFFYLLTLYCVIRGATSGTEANQGRGARDEGRGTNPANYRSQVGGWPPGSAEYAWYAAAVAACLSGMATKEVVVTAPLVVLLYDRTLLAGSFAEAWRRRWGLYVGLAATWALLLYLVCITGLAVRQPEMGAPDLWSYVRTQPGVILHYLRLSVWPNPLCLDYEWPIANTFFEIALATIAVGLLLAATLWGLVHQKAWGLLGAWFFLILAPTSSIFPLGELAYEHRTYLALAAVVVLVVTGGYAIWERLWPRASQVVPWRFSPSVTPGETASSAGSNATVPGLTTLARWAAPAAMWLGVLLVLCHLTAQRNQAYESSLTIWQDTVDKHPSSSFAHNNLGMSLATAGRTDEAIGQYEQALALKPHYVSAHNNLGISLAVAGRFNEAIEHLQQALRWSPEDAEAHNNLGSALLSSGKTGEAIEHYQKALRLKPDYAEAHNDLGTALARLGKNEEAIQHYQEALRLKPDYALAHKYLGNLLLALGRTREAIGHYEQALGLNPTDAGFHNNLGNALFNARKVDQAIEHYQEALRLKPDFAEAHNNLGFALAAVGRGTEAIEHYNQALRIKPDDATAHYNLANVLATLGWTSKAIEHYRRALELNPDDAAAHYNLGTVLATVGGMDEAIDHFRQALRLKPNSSLVRDSLANAHYGLAGSSAAAGWTSEAAEHYRQTLQLLPDSLQALNNLAWLLATQEAAEGGDPVEAVRLAQRARELSNEENPQCLDTLAAAYAAAGRFDDAILTAERATALASSAGQAALAEAIGSRLELYRAGRPYRQPPR